MNIMKRSIQSLKSAVPLWVKIWVKNRVSPMKNMWSLEKRCVGIMELYNRKMGYEFDLHRPVLFTEKLQWYKLFYDRPDLTEIVDKYLFKGFKGHGHQPGSVFLS